VDRATTIGLVEQGRQGICPIENVEHPNSISSHRPRFIRQEIDVELLLIQRQAQRGVRLHRMQLRLLRRFSESSMRTDVINAGNLYGQPGLQFAHRHYSCVCGLIIATVGHRGKSGPR